MTGCGELLTLVEKLHDLEATPAEKLAAEAHLEKCASCRSHFQFLETLSEESRSMTFHEPPESYWEHLPRKVLERIDSMGRRPSGFFGFLFAPSVLRWGALTATLVVVAALGVSLLREDWNREPSPPASASLPASVPSFEPAKVQERPMATPPTPSAPVLQESQARSNPEPQAAPPMARDEAAEAEFLPESEESEVALAAGAPAEPAVSVAPSDDLRVSAPKESVAGFESANRLRRTAAPAAKSARFALEDCESMRRAADSFGKTPSGTDARYRLALCSLQRNEREPSEALEVLAVEDAKAFLALEGQGARAEEVREKLRRIKPD